MAKRTRSTKTKRGNSPATKQVSRAEATITSSSNNLDFTHDYYYVYTDIRLMIMISILMIGVMFGLAYLIQGNLLTL